MKTKTIKVYREIAEVDAEWAGETRDTALEHGITVLNFIGSPGSGKTALLEKMSETEEDLSRMAVLEGDIATTRDGERLQAKGIRVLQLLTDGGCHLSAQLIHRAFLELPLAELDLVVIENVGNLVCPACFDVGEAAKVAVLSVTEGEEKPLKYPRLFRDAGAVVLTKIDLLPYIPFDLDACLAALAQVNAELPVFQVSVVTGHGMTEWLAWVRALRRGDAYVSGSELKAEKGKNPTK